MKHEVAIQSPSRWSGFHPTLKLAAETTLAHEDAEVGSLTVVLTNQDHSRELNRSFAGEDHPTDVLSFSDGSPDPDTGNIHFGDVIISVDIAQSQARTAGHLLSEELSLLVVHGVLHLLGYDHADPASKQDMWSAQRKVLNQIGINLADERMDA